jgi:glycosyltransferase involved in cell wall biosynthesis
LDCLTWEQFAQERFVCARLRFVIPVYRAERILRELYRQLTTALEEIGSEFETIFVEDGGGDGSWSIIVDLARADPQGASPSVRIRREPVSMQGGEEVPAVGV